MAGKDRIDKALQGMERGCEVFGKDFMREHILKWEKVDADFSRLLVGFIYGGIRARGILDPKISELCAISALTVLQAWQPLQSHIKNALTLGVTEAEVKEAIVQMAVYGGVPNFVQAWPYYEKAVEEFKRAKPARRSRTRAGRAAAGPPTLDVPKPEA